MFRFAFGNLKHERNAPHTMKTGKQFQKSETLKQERGNINKDRETCSKWFPSLQLKRTQEKAKKVHNKTKINRQKHNTYLSQVPGRVVACTCRLCATSGGRHVARARRTAHPKSAALHGRARQPVTVLPPPSRTRRKLPDIRFQRDPCWAQGG